MLHRNKEHYTSAESSAKKRENKSIITLMIKIPNNMRRSHSGSYSYEPLPSTSTHNAIEDESERMTEELKHKIHALKSLSIDIGTEVKYQDKLLRNMDDDFERTSGSLSGSVTRVLRLAKAGHNYYILYLFLFSVAVFFILWAVLRFK